MRSCSSYYPPRARWYSRARRPWLDLKRILHIEEFQASLEVSPRNFLLGWVLPGHAFLARGERTVGRMVLTAYLVAAGVFIVALGYTLANVAFGLMISAHVVSILYLIERHLGNPTLRGRMVNSLLALVLLSLVIYWPLLHQLQKHWVIPLRIGDDVIIVGRSGNIAAVRRGDLVAYETPRVWHDHRYIEAGSGMERVLGMAGDRIRFTPRFVLVNGRPRAREAHMPAQGEVLVPPNHWFVWPELAVVGHADLPAPALSAMFWQAAMISQTQYLGRPLAHWFGRRQISP